MQPLSIVFRSLAVLGGIAAVVLFFLINGKLEEKENQLQNTQAQLAQTQGNLASEEQRAAGLENDLSQTRANLATEQRTLESTRSELLAARAEASRTADRLREEQRERQRTADELTGVRRELTTAQRTINELPTRSEFDRIVRERADFESRNERLEDRLRIAEMRAQAQSPQASGEQRDASGNLRAMSRPTDDSGVRTLGATTTIAGINASQGVLVLSGNASELSLNRGDTITLISNLEAVARVQISRSSENEILANILPGSRTSALAQGLEVRILR